MEKVLKKIEQMNGPENKYWIVARDTGNFLQILIRIFKIKSVLEVGTGIGYSGILMGAELAKMGGHLTTIESNRERFALAKGNFEEAGMEAVITQVAGHAPEVIHTLRGPFEMIFLDAIKKHYLEHFEAAFPLLTQGAIIAIDNVFSHKQELQPFLESLEKYTKVAGGLMKIGTGLGLYRKM